MLLVGHLLSVPKKMENKHKGVANLCLKSPLCSLHHPYFYHLFPLIRKKHKHKHICTQTQTHMEEVSSLLVILDGQRQVTLTGFFNR